MVNYFVLMKWAGRIGKNESSKVNLKIGNSSARLKMAIFVYKIMEMKFGLEIFGLNPYIKGTS